MNLSAHPEWQERTIQLIGEHSSQILGSSHVLVVGLGGVGAMAAEMLCRAGIGNLTIIDGDIVQAGNINRQLPAKHSTIGESKARLLGNNLKDINPDLELTHRVCPDQPEAGEPDRGVGDAGQDLVKRTAVKKEELEQAVVSSNEGTKQDISKDSSEKKRPTAPPL